MVTQQKVTTETEAPSTSSKSSISSWVSGAGTSFSTQTSKFFTSIKSGTSSLAKTISSFTSSVYKKAKSFLSKSLSWFSGLWSSSKSSKKSEGGKKVEVQVSNGPFSVLVVFELRASDNRSQRPMRRATKHRRKSQRRSR